MRVGAEHGVGEGLGVPVAGAAADHLGQVLEIHLVDDARIGRHDAEVPERVLPPAEKGVALAVALELALDVHPKRRRRAEGVDLHRVVDDEIGGLERIDARGIAAEPAHGVAHRREVDDRRHAGEVLEEHARGHEGDLAVGHAPGLPGEQRLDVVAGERAAVLVSQHVLEQDLEGKGQPRGALAEGRQAVDHDLRAAHRERAAGPVAVPVRSHVGDHIPAARRGKNPWRGRCGPR